MLACSKQHLLRQGVLYNFRSFIVDIAALESTPFAFLKPVAENLAGLFNSLFIIIVERFLIPVYCFLGLVDIKLYVVRGEPSFHLVLLRPFYLEIHFSELLPPFSFILWQFSLRAAFLEAVHCSELPVERICGRPSIKLRLKHILRV